MVDYDLIKEMFKLQNEFNEYTVKDWKNANLAWHRAIWLECAEAVDSTPWKWWKKGELDENNLKVELVDIWHFLMSYSMIHFPDLAKNPENYHKLFELEGSIPDVDIVVMIEDLAGLVLEKPNDEQIYTIFIFINAWSKLGFTVNDLYREYVIKNVLNKFRQDNGYKTGIYKKMWDSNGKSYEDNVITWELAETVELNDHMFDNLYSKLNEFYTNMN